MREEFIIGEACIYDVRTPEPTAPEDTYVYKPGQQCIYDVAPQA